MVEAGDSMLDQKQWDLIRLIRSALTGKPATLSDTPDSAYLYKTAARHQVMGLLMYGCTATGVSDAALQQRLFMASCRNVAVSEQQMHELQGLFSAFENQGIDYLPLKGTVLKSLYEHADMRSMGDADVLIRLQDRDRIAAILTERGYSAVGESDHEIVWKHPSLLLELHKRVVPQRDKKYYAYFGDGWTGAQLVEGTVHRYAMTDERMLIYLFVHFTKHYAGAGIGIKHMVDLWVYTQKHPDLDRDCVEHELDKLGLLAFYRNVMHALQTWFGDTEMTDRDVFVTDVIFQNGVFGSEENSAVARLSQKTAENGVKNTKFRRVLSLVFPPYSSMKYIFPVLQKWPILLPVMWPVRIVRTLLFRRNKISSELEGVQNLTDDKIVAYRRSMEYVGLNVQ